MKINFTDLIDFLFVIIALVLGLIIIKEDLKDGKIRNKWIVLGLKLGLALYVLLFAWSLFTHFNLSFLGESFVYYPLKYYFIVALNFVFSAVISYLFWQHRLWSAGDAKLFILFSFLLPLKYYSNGYLPLFPSSALLTNVFVPIFAFLMVRIAVDFLRNIVAAFYRHGPSFLLPYWQGMKFNFNNNIKNKRRTVAFAVSFFLTFVIMPIARNQITSLLSSILSGGFLIFASFYLLQNYIHEYIDKYLKKNLVLVLFVFLIPVYFIFGYIYFFEAMVFSLEATLKIAFSFMIILILIEKLADFYINGKEVIMVDVENLKPKMIISEEIMREIENNKELKTKVGDFHAEGLSSDQIDILKPWLIKTDKKKVPVYKTFSFGIWIFAGVILTILLKQSILHLFLTYIK